MSTLTTSDCITYLSLPNRLDNNTIDFVNHLSYDKKVECNIDWIMKFEDSNGNVFDMRSTDLNVKKVST